MSDQSQRYWLGLGTNLGEREIAIRSYLGALGRHGVHVEAVSSVYETAPVHVVDQPDFLNAAARVRTGRAPEALLVLVKRLERQFGRVPGPRFGPRAIDCDILAWSGGSHLSATLEIPHPRLAERRFALAPLAEIDADLRLPGGLTVRALLKDVEGGADTTR